MLFEAYPRYYSSFVKAAMDPRDIHLVLRLSTKFYYWDIALECGKHSNLPKTAASCIEPHDIGIVKCSCIHSITLLLVT